MINRIIKEHRKMLSQTGCTISYPCNINVLIERMNIQQPIIVWGQYYNDGWSNILYKGPIHLLPPEFRKLSVTPIDPYNRNMNLLYPNEFHVYHITEERGIEL